MRVQGRGAGHGERHNCGLEPTSFVGGSTHCPLGRLVNEFSDATLLRIALAGTMIVTVLMGLAFVSDVSLTQVPLITLFALSPAFLLILVVRSRLATLALGTMMLLLNWLALGVVAVVEHEFIAFYLILVALISDLTILAGGAIEWFQRRRLQAPR